MAVSSKAKVTECLEAARHNYKSIAENGKLVFDRGKKIEANREQIQQNQQAVASMLVEPIATDAVSA